jgi:hypothetical protein
VKREIRTLFICLLAAGAARADIIYQVTVDTTPIQNTSGFLDFDFAPGNNSQAAFIQVSGFSPGGALAGAPQVSGGVSGTLPGLLAIDNSTAFNDYFQGFNYGDSISFLITLGGPAIDSPNGTATSGSTFGFAMFDATGSNPLLTSDPNGNAFTIDVNLDGSATVNDFSANAQVALAAQPVPEPASFWLLGIVLAGIIASQYIVRLRRSARKLEGES